MNRTVVSGEWREGEEDEHRRETQKLRGSPSLAEKHLVKDIYHLTVCFPPDERFGLVSQLRRAAVSVPSNIAEGQSRHTSGEFIQCLSHAEGSLAELETQLLIAEDLEFCSKKEANQVLAQTEELQRMLNSLRQKLATRH
jgi:four helix bundle protein